MKKTAKLLSLMLVLCCMVGTTSCLSDQKIIYLHGADTMYAVPQQIAQAFELQIQSDDQLAISVASKTPELIQPFNTNTLIGGGVSGLSGSNTANIQSGISYFTVDKNGDIFFPIFGKVKVTDMTCRQLAEALQKRLIEGNYILDAVVNVKIMSFKVTVLGDVRNPGTQTFTGERLTLLEALGRAGDLNSSAKRDHVLVVREENGKRMTYDIDLRNTEQVFQSPAYYLQQNDVVYVQPNKSVRVKGSTGYTLLSVGATVVSMLVSVVSLVIALKR